MDNNCNMKWLEWAKELQFLAQVGWICTKDPNHKWKNTVKSVSLGYGCKRCSKRHQYSTEEWIQIANQIHNGKYNYHHVNYITSVH